MKRIFTALLLSALMAIISIDAFAQKQINITTKKDKIGDFKAKTTKVVLPGNDISDAFLKDGMSSCWTLSPYEFCSKDEFESLKTNENYYFLLSVAGQSKKEAEPGITFLSLVKGGKEAESGISDMLEVVSIPYCSSKFPSGREVTYLTALLDIMQDFTQKTLSGELKGISNLSFYNQNLSKCKNKDVVFSQEDLAEDVTDEAIEKYFKKGMIVMDEDSADEVYLNGDSPSAVSYVVAPSKPEEGSYCYKMIIDSYNHDLYYFRKHKITSKVSSGFLVEDIKKVSTVKGK